jgi:hypothetical protein
MQRDSPEPGGNLSALKCKIQTTAGIKPGYMADAAGALFYCPRNTYNPGGQIWTPGAAVSCTPCPSGTGIDDFGSQSAESCLVLPGHGLDPATNRSAPCAVGAYNEGYNRAPCKRCGANIYTSSTGSVSSEQCVTPAGFGSGPFDGAEFAAFPCPADSFGDDQTTTGLVRVDCTRCHERMTTNNATASQSELACVTRPGVGYYNEAPRLCDFGEWSAGGGRQPCSRCGPGYTTAETGAASVADCQVQQGWTVDGAGGVKACAIGLYKETLGPAACLACPNGTSTSANAADWLGNCNVCKPGFGADQIDADAPRCDPCRAGTFNQGGGMWACQACGGGMVSKPVRVCFGRVVGLGERGRGLCWLHTQQNCPPTCLPALT